MPMIQVWLNDKQMEQLKKLKEILDEYEGGKSIGFEHQHVGRGKHRHIAERKRVNNSYVVSRALNRLMIETENILNPPKKSMSPEEIRKHNWFPKRGEPQNQER
jgi:hypothetical protein